MEIFDKNRVFDPLGVEIELWHIHVKRCARPNYWGTGWPMDGVPNLFLKICNLVLIFHNFLKNLSTNFWHKKLEKTKNLCSGELYIFCFIISFVLPNIKVLHSKNLLMAKKVFLMQLLQVWTYKNNYETTENVELI